MGFCPLRERKKRGDRMGMTKGEFRAAVLADQAKRKQEEKRQNSIYWEYRRDLKTRIVRKTCYFGTSHLRPGRGKG